MRRYKLKAIIKTIAALTLLAFSAPAFAGGVVVADDGVSKLKLETDVFSKLTRFDRTSNGKDVTKTQSLNVDRAYFTIKYDFNSDWMMRITTDVVLTDAVATPKGGLFTPGPTPTTTIKKNNNIFLKYAYVQGKLYGDAVVLRLGQSHTPWIDHEEHLWGHRFFSPVLIDKNGYDASSDLGIGLKGKVLDGMANYWVTYTNGPGYSHPGGLNNKLGDSMDIDARVGFEPIAGLTLDFQYRNGYKGTKFRPATAAQAAAETKSILEQIMVTYGSGHDYRIGANYARNKVSKLQAVPAVADVTQSAYALWGWTKFFDDFGAFGRYEYTKDDKLAATQLKKIRYAGGIEYFPVKHVTLALGYDYTKTTIGGGPTLANPEIKDTRYGLWSEFKF